MIELSWIDKNMEQSLYQRLRSFLRDQNCEKEFDRAFYLQCGANYLDERLSEYLVIDESFFGRCFDWCKTKEGRQYWKDIDTLWWNAFLSQPKDKM